jgi:hypothetical protein
VNGQRLALEEVELAVCSAAAGLVDGCVCRLKDGGLEASIRTVRVFRQKFTLEDAIGSHACSLEANMRVTNGIPLGSSILLPVCTVNCVQTLKASITKQSILLAL